MIERILTASVLLGLVVASSVLYDHRGRAYARERRASEATTRGFKRVYAWVRITTPPAVLGALLSEHAAWLTLHRDRIALYAGLALAVASFGLFIASKRALGRQYSPCFDAFQPSELIAEGPYARVRHPIYTANLGLLAGMALATGSVWVTLNLLLVGAFYLRAARLEERELARALPGYRTYLLRTGAFLPPLRLTSRASG